jgi:peptide/nickel transport system permease protein
MEPGSESGAFVGRYLRRRAHTGRAMTGASRTAAWVAVGAVILVTLVALLAGVLAPHDPVQPVGDIALSPGSPGFPLGTDGIGRDLLSRTLIGIRVSWFSSLLVVFIGLVVGGLIGLVAGAFGGWIDAVLMRGTDLFLALPGALVAIAIVAALGPSLRNTLIAISLVWWPYYARIIRGEVRAIATRSHVEAARLSGVGPARLLWRHILPGVVPTAIVAASLDVGNVVLLLAGLSFLGLGQAAPAPELGADTARSLNLLLIDPWVPIIPALAVMLLSLVANLGGDGLRTLLAGRR